MKLFIPSLLVLTLVSTSASAAILNADSTNLQKVFAAAQDGDTIKASGTFGSLVLQNRTFATGVTLDATNAVFADSLTIRNVHGMNVLKGTFGSETAYMRIINTIAVEYSSNLKFQSNTFVGTGTTAARNADQGLSIRWSKLVQVSNTNYSNLRIGIAVIASTDVKLSSNTFTRMTSDGINIWDSHRVFATENTCNGTLPFLNAHPDCIQLWSIRGNPVQSDVTLFRNVALGATQGFTSFDPTSGGGLRISMIGNIVSTSYAQGIACYNCVDSVFTDNMLSTLPSAQHRTSISIVGGANNYIANNTIGPRYQVQSGLSADLSTLTTSSNLASLSTSYFFGNTPYGFAAVPELSEWFMLTIGFGMIGGFARRSKHGRRRCCA